MVMPRLGTSRGARGLGEQPPEADIAISRYHHTAAPVKSVSPLGMILMPEGSSRLLAAAMHAYVTLALARATLALKPKLTVYGGVAVATRWHRADQRASFRSVLRVSNYFASAWRSASEVQRTGSARRPRSPTRW
jgi:hypothetical protein